MSKQEDYIQKLMKEDNALMSKASRIPYFPLTVASAKGAVVTDLAGVEYIDFLASAACVNAGHSHPKVVQAIKDQADKYILYNTSYSYTEPQLKLAKELHRITPGKFNKKTSYGLSGSDAVDGVIKLARAYTGRTNIVSFIDSYHGSTYGALSLSAISLNMRKKMGPFLPGVHHIPYPYCYRCPMGQKEENCKLECLDQLKKAFESYLPPEDVAALVFEPIAGDAGMVVPPKKYVKALYELCQYYGILFVSEEVQQGFGRTGKWFAIEHFDVVPDAIVVAKSIASGMPISAIVAREELMNSWGAPAHAFSMSGNPISCQAALATISVIEEENLIEKARTLGEYLLRQFQEIKSRYEIIGDVRGKGLSIGVEIIKDRKSKEKDTIGTAKICYRCYEKGLILTFLGQNSLRIQPPLVISKAQIDKALGIIEEAIKEYLNDEIPNDVLKFAKGW